MAHNHTGERLSAVRHPRHAAPEGKTVDSSGSSRAGIFFKKLSPVHGMRFTGNDSVNGKGNNGVQNPRQCKLFEFPARFILFFHMLSPEPATE
jgi:hypothetical protein